jgi:hypothetical protein
MAFYKQQQEHIAENIMQSEWEMLEAAAAETALRCMIMWCICKAANSM